MRSWRTNWTLCVFCVAHICVASGPLSLASFPFARSLLSVIPRPCALHTFSPNHAQCSDSGGRSISKRTSVRTTYSHSSTTQAPTSTALDATTPRPTWQTTRASVGQVVSRFDLIALLIPSYLGCKVEKDPRGFESALLYLAPGPGFALGLWTESDLLHCCCKLPTSSFPRPWRHRKVSVISSPGRACRKRGTHSVYQLGRYHGRGTGCHHHTQVPYLP